MARVFSLVASETSTRLAVKASKQSANVCAFGASTSARSASAGLRPAASSPAIRSRRVRASFIVGKDPPWMIG
jgi:hypothetical protein